MYPCSNELLDSSQNKSKFVNDSKFKSKELLILNNTSNEEIS
jgi:hypothetical protein